MFIWIAAALAAPSSLHIFVGGETVAVHHGEYCSYPRVAGVTTEASAPLKFDDFDGVFDPEALSKGFSGLVLYNGELPVAAHPIQAQLDVRQPSPEFKRWAELFASCRTHALEGASLPELMRKLSPGARSVLVRSLTNDAFASTSCGMSMRTAFLEEAFACAAGKCDPFVKRISTVHDQRCD